MQQAIFFQNKISNKISNQQIHALEIEYLVFFISIYLRTIIS